MRLPAIRSSLSARLRHPGWWAVGLALGSFPGLFGILGSSVRSYRLFLGLALTLPILNLGLFFCPAPWQWTGDDRPLAPWWRGLLQLVIFGFALGLLSTSTVWLAQNASARDSYHLGGMVGLGLPFMLLMGPAGWIVAKAERLAQETREAQARARETQWMSHRGAFSPRLLFSNLNHLAALAGSNTRSAEQGLVDLASLYRRWLVEAELPLVPLSTDRDLTEQYLALERGRWGDRLSLRWHLAPDLGQVQVPPLFLQPLLEAILEPEPTAALDVDLAEHRLQPGLLEFRLRVRGAIPFPEERLLQHLRQRLQSALGREAEVVSTPCPGGWEASLRIPIPDGEARP
ncbi:MAG TPA: histidine kinase [Geothrix sp.]|nr:histidine kinase [Geothrix sp.]